MCIAGYFSQEGATAPCFICPVGYYSSQSAAACTICDSDTVAPYAGMSSCTACGTGQIAPVGSTGCGFCGTGTYKSSINTCTSCLNTGMATCNRIDGSGVSCNVGYGLTNGNCFPCLAGFASPQGTLTQCKLLLHLVLITPVLILPLQVESVLRDHSPQSWQVHAFHVLSTTIFQLLEHQSALVVLLDQLQLLVLLFVHHV